jgi:aryl-alcohol dehydrogenase-like predicted oxidoreductase
VDRRTALRTVIAAGLASSLPGLDARAAIARPVPSSGETLPVIGLGTWITFDVGAGEARSARGEILRAFLAAGGRLVDSSPMYGEAEETIGAEYARIGRPAGLFSATKVWTVGDLPGRRQVERSRSLWGVPRFDLLQVHNLLDWKTHLATLREMKAQGRVRYIGVTTSHGRRHDLVEELLRRERLDFVQFTYSLADREAESRLLGLARDRGAAVIVNRPFDGGAMFARVRGKPLPGWGREIGCTTWAAAFLKFIVSHPAVTCAIPATSQLAHLRENMAALSGPVPDEGLRRRIAADFDNA